MREIIKVVGTMGGTTSVIMAGVHGNEPCGLSAFTSLLPTLKIDAGIVYFIIGNPNAIAKNVRFTDFNLNRAFKSDGVMTKIERSSYEYRRAQFLKLYLNEASALLDIHSSFTFGSFPFVICEDNGLTTASRLPVELVTSGFDRTNPGGTDEYMNRIGKIGICIECGYHLDPSANGIAEQAILSFLWSRGHVILPAFREKKEQRRVVVKKLYRSVGKLELSKNWSDFETILTGSLICTDDGKEIRAEENCIILFARNCEQAGQEAFYLGT